jgi:hypothetical protein
MLKDTTVIRLRQPDAIDDPLTELAREGARRMLAQRWRRLRGDLIGFQECRRQSQVRTRLSAGESGIRYLTF